MGKTNLTAGLYKTDETANVIWRGKIPVLQPNHNGTTKTVKMPTEKSRPNADYSKGSYLIKQGLHFFITEHRLENIFKVLLLCCCFMSTVII